MKLPQGFRLTGIHCGIKKKGLDLGLICCDGFCEAAAFFTKNTNPSYSVVWSKKNIGRRIKAVLVNSGNANCFSHRRGLADTGRIISQLAQSLGVEDKNILIASTGIIGKKLPHDKVIKSFPPLMKELDKRHAAGREGSRRFSRSILTTDTFEKISYAKLRVKAGEVNILGIAKGAGMIYPNLATMLAFILTDVNLPSFLLQKMGRDAVEDSFNSISVDGCMSTNDSVFLLSSAKTPLCGVEETNKFWPALKKVCLDLAKMIVRDAEGATKFVELEINGAKTKEEAKQAGFCIANYNLFKCSLYGANNNRGRIVAALGGQGISVGESIYVKATPLKNKEVKITIDLKRGKYAGKVYTSDLTPQYVKINAG